MHVHQKTNRVCFAQHELKPDPTWPATMRMLSAPPGWSFMKAVPSYTWVQDRSSKLSGRQIERTRFCDAKLWEQ